MAEEHACASGPAGSFLKPDGTAAQRGNKEGGQQRGCCAEAATQSDTGGMDGAVTVDVTSGKPVKLAVDVARGLSRSLWLFAGAGFYVTVVQVYLLTAPSAQHSTDEVEAGGLSGTINPLVNVPLAMSIIILELLVATLSGVAAHYVRNAAKLVDTPPELSKMIEKAVLFLSAIFNTLAVAVGLKTLVDITSAAVVYPAIFVVIAMCTLAITVFWASGFLVLQVWYGRSKWIGSTRIVGLLSSPLEEVEQIPSFIRFWLNQVFGRFELQRRGDLDINKKEAAFKFEIDMTHWSEVVFSKEQTHILKLLPEAMSHSGSWIALRVFTCTLVLVTYCLARLWGNVATQALEIVKNVMALSLILSGAVLFNRALKDNHSDMHNLVEGFASLANTFKRLTTMFIVTTTLQLISSIVAAVLIGS